MLPVGSRQLSGMQTFCSSTTAPLVKGKQQAVRNIRCRVGTAVERLVERGTLSPAQIEQFYKDGFLVLPNAVSKADCQKLSQRVAQLLEDFDPDTIRSVFTTRNQAQKTDEYFLQSAGDISFFLEEKAFDPDTGKLKQAKELSVNKIGHALHDLDPVFHAFSRSPEVAAILKSLGYQRPLPVQSMFICKQPNIGGEVVPHQDSTFLHTTPLSCTGLWWALEDATKENGCLWAYPGIHKEGLRRRFFLREDRTVAFDNPQPDWDLSKFVPLECEAGTLVLLQGENVHYSCENTSPMSRHSYSMHVVEGAAGVHWAKDNWAHRGPGQPNWEPMYDLTQSRDGPL